MIVVDASVIATALADDRVDGDSARARLRQSELMAPELVDVEVLSVLRKLWLLGDVDEHRFLAATEDLIRLPLRRYPMLPFVARAAELRANVTPYDAMYVALAEAAAVTLLTADRRLASAPGIGCAVELLPLDRTTRGRENG